MQTHTIENIMATTLEQLRGLVDVTTIVGQPIQAGPGRVILPVSRACLGFVAGGAEYGESKTQPADLPFGGGAGAGVTMHPVAFLVAGEEGIQLLSVGMQSPVDRLIQALPQFVREVREFLKHDQAQS